MLRQLIRAVGLCCLMAAAAQAATIHGPSPYLSLDNTPEGIFVLGANDTLHVEDFEDPDGPWEVCFSINVGQRIGPKFVSGDNVPVTDSVDADDNAIDGDGTMGSSWFTSGRTMMLTFDDPTKATGFVLTDADNDATQVTIKAYGADGSELVSQSYDTDFLDDVFTGTTQEDRFFGVTAMGNDYIKRVQISIDQGEGIEIDHVQLVKTETIPEPSAIALAGLGLLGLLCFRRRR